MTTALLLALATSVSAPATPTIKLYALDCGHAEAADMSFLSDTGDYDGQAFKVVVPCFLIRHPKGDFLWGAGLGDTLAVTPPKEPIKGFKMSVPTTLKAQLQQLGMTYDDIEIFGFSHAHADHIGNAPNLTKATWLLPAAELEWALKAPGQHPELLEARSKVKTIDASGDYDVFGDGSVRMLQTPGHTPAHHALLVKLGKAGTYILSGDAAHQRESFEHSRVPVFNVSRADTLASLDRIKRLMTNLKAKLIVEHDTRDFDALPKFPAFLE